MDCNDPTARRILYARIFAHLNALNKEEAIQGLCINYSKRSLHFNKDEIILTKTEFDILELISKHPNMVFDKERIYSRLWGFHAVGDNAVVAEHVRNLRKKIKKHTEDPIQTVWGVGYKWHG